MLLIDYRQGSQELIQPLCAMGLDAVETELAAGDIAFEGRGELGRAVQIGIEFKTVPELVGAMQTGRLAGHQLLEMRGAEDGGEPLYDYSWLLYEGDVLYDKQGRMLKRIGRRDFKALPGGMRINEFLKRLYILHLNGGLNPLWSPNRRTTLKMIETLYRVWTDKDLDEHKSHLAIYQPPTLVPLSQFRRTVATLPGIGIRRSLSAEHTFGGSVWRAMAASEKDWAAVEVENRNGKTKRLGTEAARKIVEAIRMETR